MALGLARTNTSLTMFSIGRSDGSDIIINDISVSRQHAQIEDLGGGRYRIIDLGSVNGCCVRSNDDWREVREAEVRAADRLLIGEYETTVRELMRRAQTPRGPGITVVADAEATRHGRRQRDALTPVHRVRRLRSGWHELPLIQRNGLTAAAIAFAVLVVAAAIVAIAERV
jgi:predicted component of type VI protein secretion system